MFTTMANKWTALYKSSVSACLGLAKGQRSKLGFNSQGHIGTGPQNCHLWDSNPQRCLGLANKVLWCVVHSPTSFFGLVMQFCAGTGLIKLHISFTTAFMQCLSHCLCAHGIYTIACDGFFPLAFL